MKRLEDIGEFHFNELDLENEFWHFSLTVWKNKDVRTCLLDCQNERGLRVNQMLFAFWASCEAIVLSRFYESKPSAIDEWYHAILEPIRKARKSLPKDKLLLEFRQGLQDKELQAEQIEQAMMYHWAKCHDKETVEGDLLDTLLNNLVLSGVRDSALLLMLTKLFTCVCHKPLPMERDIVDRISRLVDNTD